MTNARNGGLLSDLGGSGATGLRLTKVQVGLVALARQLKGHLDDIAQDADTDSSEGLQALLQGEHRKRGTGEGGGAARGEQGERHPWP